MIGNSAPTCPGCQLNLGSGKKTIIRNAPIYLIVHLKRFTNTGLKIDRKVLFNDRLLLANRYYALACCVLHRGTTESGHYTTLFWENNNRWTLLDDDAVHAGIPDRQAGTMLEDFGYIGFYRAIQMI